jgi:hypothetical protein
MIEAGRSRASGRLPAIRYWLTPSASPALRQQHSFVDRQGPRFLRMGLLAVRRGACLDHRRRRRQDFSAIA